MISKKKSRRLNNGHQPQLSPQGARPLVSRSRLRHASLSAQSPLAPEWQEFNEDLRIGRIWTQTEPSKKFEADEPDFWNYAAVGVLGTFYVASLVSTYVSTNLLLYLLSGGAGIAVPMFGTQLPITEAVALMGAGILEGTSLSDAYLEHKKHLTGSRRWISSSGRFLAFVAQGLLYYMALGQLLFATSDVSSLGAQGFEEHHEPAPLEASLVLEPPTALHGVFVGTISFAWSFRTTYIGSTAVLVAIERLRRKHRRKL
jgi:hypothetical protein